LTPRLSDVASTSQVLAELAEADGAQGTAADLLKIAAAAAHLGDLVGGALLPQDAPDPASVPPDLEEGTAGEARAGRLLIVDDHALNRDLLARRLERLGYATAQAADGEEALALLRAAPFD